MNKFFAGLFLLVTFSACEKDISFDLNQQNPVIVVDAQIENGQGPIVVLSRSLNYFGAISPQILAASFVHSANITVANGSLVHRLREYSFPLGNNYIGYYYGVDSSSLSTAFVGEFGKTYGLTINVRGVEYRSITTIPLLTKVADSLWFKIAPNNPDPNKRVLMARVTDPPGLGNYVRYFTKINQGPFLPGYNSVFSDEVVDGTTYQGQVDPGVDRNNPPGTGENFFQKGDTVTLKLSNIDRPTYRFWTTWEFMQQSIGNPFSQPGKVEGNISNGALGAFCGYASWTGTAIAR